VRALSQDVLTVLAPNPQVTALVPNLLGGLFHRLNLSERPELLDQLRMRRRVAQRGTIGAPRQHILTVIASRPDIAISVAQLLRGLLGLRLSEWPVAALNVVQRVGRAHSGGIPSAVRQRETPIRLFLPQVAIPVPHLPHVVLLSPTASSPEPAHWAPIRGMGEAQTSKSGSVPPDASPTGSRSSQ